MKGMVASLEDKALDAAPKKKRRAVLFSDSNDDLDQETDEVTNSATAPDEIDAYSTTNFDFEDGHDAPLAFWKSHRTRFRKLAVIAELTTGHSFLLPTPPVVYLTRPDPTRPVVYT